MAILASRLPLGQAVSQDSGKACPYAGLWFTASQSGEYKALSSSQGIGFMQYQGTGDRLVSVL